MCGTCQELSIFHIIIIVIKMIKKSRLIQKFQQEKFENFNERVVGLFSSLARVVCVFSNIRSGLIIVDIIS